MNTNINHNNKYVFIVYYLNKIYCTEYRSFYYL